MMHVTLLYCPRCGARTYLKLGESAPAHQHPWRLEGAAKLEAAFDVAAVD